jgi:hypothetical protein
MLIYVFIKINVMKAFLLADVALFFFFLFRIKPSGHFPFKINLKLRILKQMVGVLGCGFIRLHGVVLN